VVFFQGKPLLAILITPQYCETGLTQLGSAVMMVVVTMMMVRLRKCGSRNHQDHGKKQRLFHVNIIATKDRRAARCE
jgi:hypothetical protein